jgi:hypothetical protein
MKTKPTPKKYSMIHPCEGNLGRIIFPSVHPAASGYENRKFVEVFFYTREQKAFLQFLDAIPPQTKGMLGMLLVIDNLGFHLFL